MAGMTTEQLKAWVTNLKPGDAVGVYESRGTRLVYETVVERKTPTGRVVCSGGETFKPDGYRYAPQASCYRDRHIRPLPGR